MLGCYFNERIDCLLSHLFQFVQNLLPSDAFTVAAGKVLLNGPNSNQFSMWGLRFSQLWRFIMRSFAFKMNVVCFFRMLIITYQTMWSHNPQNHNINNCFPIPELSQISILSLFNMMQGWQPCCPKKKKNCCEIQRCENRMQSGRIFWRRLWLKKGCFARDDDLM
jgi:hypothetical protein